MPGERPDVLVGNPPGSRAGRDEADAGGCRPCHRAAAPVGGSGIDPLGRSRRSPLMVVIGLGCDEVVLDPTVVRSEEHTSELQSLMRISYAVFCLTQKTIDDYSCHNITLISTQRYRITPRH